MLKTRVLAVVLAVVCFSPPAPLRAAPADPLLPLKRTLEQYLAVTRERADRPLSLKVAVTHFDGAKKVTDELNFDRQADDAFRVLLRYRNQWVDLVRSPKTCYLHLGEESLVFVGESSGESPPEKILTLPALLGGIAGLDGRGAVLVNMLRTMSVEELLAAARAAGFSFEAGPREGMVQHYRLMRNGRLQARLVAGDVTMGDLLLTVGEGKAEISVKSHFLWGTYEHSAQRATPPDPTAKQAFQLLLLGDWLPQTPPGVAGTHEHKQVSVPRAELERSLLRGLIRFAEIKYDERWAPRLRDAVHEGPHGRYTIQDGRRVVRLRGAPFELGRQHGLFLKDEVRKVLESTLYVVGMGYSVEQGRWFLDDIRAATARLERFTPPEFREELRGLAEGAGQPYEHVLLASYFPALFHCSGFTLAGGATVGGKLYHGRVLDYMTGVGLEQNAVVFAVEKAGKIPFVNVGYAGFIGSVSGMNAEKISLGEMGGRGEGAWDGVTMPLLMRMALENARTLADAQRIFRENPRTCEYFYVFADGKDRTSVGVAATPEKIEFVKPGAFHALLPNPVRDCVALSAGDRYRALSGKMKARFGKFTERGALRLMEAPVALGDDNLHNVLFIPEELRLHIANAGPRGGAYNHQYHEYSFKELFRPVAMGGATAESGLNQDSINAP